MNIDTRTLTRIPEHDQNPPQTTAMLVKLRDFIGHEHNNQPEGITFYSRIIWNWWIGSAEQCVMTKRGL